MRGYLPRNFSTLLRMNAGLREIFVLCLVGLFLFQSTAGLIHSLESFGAARATGPAKSFRSTELLGAPIARVSAGKGQDSWTPDFSNLNAGIGLSQEHSATEFLPATAAHEHESSSCSLCESLHFSRNSVSCPIFEFPLPRDSTDRILSLPCPSLHTFSITLPSPRGPPLSETTAA